MQNLSFLKTLLLNSCSFLETGTLQNHMHRPTPVAWWPSIFFLGGGYMWVLQLGIALNVFDRHISCCDAMVV